MSNVFRKLARANGTWKRRFVQGRPAAEVDGGTRPNRRMRGGSYVPGRRARRSAAGERGIVEIIRAALRPKAAPRST